MEETPICPLLSRPVMVVPPTPKMQFMADAKPAVYAVQEQPCIGSRCVAWIEAHTEGYGFCGMVPHGPERQFPDPHQPKETK